MKNGVEAISRTDLPQVAVDGQAAHSMWQHQIFWFILALNFIFGALFNFLPVTYPVFRQSFGSSFEQLGRIQVLFFIAGLIFSLGGGWFVDRLGLKRSAAATLFLLAVSVAMVGGAGNFQLVLAAAFFFGLGVAALAVVYSAMICDCYPESRQSLFFLSGILAGLGAMVGPAALGKWLLHAERSQASWRTGYYTASLLLVCFLLWSIVLKTKQFAASASGRPTLRALGAMKEILRSPAIYAIGVAYLLHGVAQGGMVSWVGQLYQGRRHIDTARAAYFISVNSLGFFAGRSLLSWITSRWKISDLKLLALCAGGGTLAFIATILSSTYFSGLCTFAVAGFFISGDGPSINSFTGLRFARDTATAFAVLGGIGNLGAAAGPYIVGAVGNRLGLEKGIWLMPVFSLALAVLAFSWSRHTRADKT